ncbi:MAG TPA: hypothetical protein VJ608_13415 [Albitalea sp.]|nr:hypothetical protein [Albitalea sp.]
MNRTRRLLTSIVVILGMATLGGAAVAKPKQHHHHDGQQLLGEKIKTNGKHAIHKAGGHNVSVDVKDGKVAGLHAKHAKKGEVEVKKYKTNKKMAQQGGLRYASFVLAQVQVVDTVYIGYAFIDEYGDEQIYWFPYDMVLDGDTGAITYVPVA